MTMHYATFDYISPSTEQIDRMKICREAAMDYYNVLEQCVPEGPDKTYVIRKLREVAMWVSVAITRHADGSPIE